VITSQVQPRHPTNSSVCQTMHADRSTGFFRQKFSSNTVFTASNTRLTRIILIKKNPKQEEVALTPRVRPLIPSPTPAALPRGVFSISISVCHMMTSNGVLVYLICCLEHTKHLANYIHIPSFPLSPPQAPVVVVPVVVFPGTRQKIASLMICWISTYRIVHAHVPIPMQARGSRSPRRRGTFLFSPRWFRNRRLQSF
jgi:hypothetical protein